MNSLNLQNSDVYNQKNKLPTICLNMIVKNESKIILRLLESVLPIIDSFCICDTGSTDDTIKIIQSFFDTNKIKGKIIEEPFRDFGYNRSFALSACNDVDNSDYILLLDADMIFKINPNIIINDFKRKLIQDYYYVFQGNEYISYKNTRIIKNRLNMKYIGVTHEYVQTPKNASSSCIPIDEICINDIGDGGAKTDKYTRDIKLLLQGLIDNPNNGRYTFYLANSYREQGNFEKAIEYYKKRVELGDWIEEIWMSYYNLGKIYKLSGKKMEAVFYWLEAYNVFPSRIENLYEIIEQYRLDNKHKLAYTFYNLADFERKNNSKWDYLFTEKSVYEYNLDYELTIIGYYCNHDNYDLKNVCMKLIKNNLLEKYKFDNVISNYKFYCPSLIEKSKRLSDENNNLLQTIGNSSSEISDLISSTPSICFGKNSNELIVVVRFVNYSINDNGEYSSNENIITKNVVAVFDITNEKWVKKNESILDYDKQYDDYYIGQEDVRIHRFEKNKEVQHTYNSNRSISKNSMKVEHCYLNLSNLPNKSNSMILHIVNERPCEKNWVLFGTNKCIYSWSPLVIGEIGEIDETDQLKILSSNNSVPRFFENLRGSTNGIIIGDEIWFICHLVSYENRRFYYHIMVVLDLNTFNLKKYTPLFNFEKEIVEYTLGMVYFEPSKKFMIGYSTLDKKTCFFNTSKHIFDDMMIIHLI